MTKIFDKCKTLKLGQWVTVTQKEKNKVIAGIIDYYDYGGKQFAIDGQLINFEKVSKITVMNDDRKRQNTKRNNT